MIKNKKILTIQKKIVRTLKLYYLEKLYVKKNHTIYKYFKWDLGFGMGFGIWDLEWDLGFGIWDGIWDWDGNGIWDLGWDGMGFNMGGKYSRFAEFANHQLCSAVLIKSTSPVSPQKNVTFM